MSNRTLRILFVAICTFFATASATAQNTAIVGDMDGDGLLSAKDVTLLVNTILGHTPERELRLADGEVPWPEDPGDTPDVHEYVDLGLPSGTLWATCNVGASVPEEYGDYFAWGETQSKDSYSWQTYALCQGDIHSLTDYCTDKSYGTVDNKTELARMHDAATVAWGTAWCMPTAEQMDELIDKRYTQVSFVYVNKVYGCLISSLQCDASIFLPAAGTVADRPTIDKGQSVNCWAKTLGRDTYDACYLYIEETAAYSDGKPRYIGCTIRPVRKNHK